MNNSEHKKAYVVAVDMGYGHQRAAYPLIDIAITPKKWEGNEANTKIISANRYVGIPETDRKKWQSTRTLYEWVSRMRTIPFIGEKIFAIMDYFQKIEPFYPERDLSAPGLQTKQIFKMIDGGFGKNLINELNDDSKNYDTPLPFLTTFFMTAFMAEEHGYVGEIYCLCTDTDVSRAWAPLYPKESRINYFAPSERVKNRLQMYGIKPEKITFTGFPLPKESHKEALKRRINVLDPNKIYSENFKDLITEYLGNTFGQVEQDSLLIPSITFAVGGAGAQTEIGIAMLNSLADLIKQNKIKLNLSVGTSEEARKLFEDEIKKLNINVFVLFSKNKFEYFELFDKLLLETDILWTKPSELSFYAGLGLPIIIAPPLGSQEVFNQTWLTDMGAGFNQLSPTLCHEWLIDLINKGQVAEMAMNGYIHAPKAGNENVINSL